jgi:hypothetical protein
MKSHKYAAAAVLAAALCTGALAQPAGPAPMQAAANETVFVAQLPNAGDLTKAAAAQGISVTQIDQTSSQVLVTYKYSNGAVNTVSYQPLSAAETGGANAVPAPATPAPTLTTGSTVVYTTTAAPAYYADYPYYGYPYYGYGYGWYPPVSIGLGFGFRGGFHGGGGFRGGFHGGGRFR